MGDELLILIYWLFLLMKAGSMDEDTTEDR
jgi:hypothetical protein